MRLWLIRHGQTPSNVLGLLDTAVPGPGLTELGLEQAAAVPAALATAGIDAIYASSQTRAQLTAAPLATARGLDVKVRPGLREITAGDLEMRSDQPAIQAYLEVVGAWLSGDLEVRTPGAGESGREVLERYDAVVEEAVSSGARGVALVSHGAVIRFWATVRSVNVRPSFGAENVLHNTGIVEVDGDSKAGWRALSWTGAAVGGDDLDDAATDGPAGDPIRVRSAVVGPDADR